MSVVSLYWLGWLAGTVALFWAAPSRVRHLVLAAISLAFLTVHAPVSAVVLSVLAVLCFWLPRLSPRPAPAIFAMVLAIVALLVAYKAGILTIGAAFDDTGAVVRLVMPLGLSYYAFRCIHYLLEHYKGALPPHRFSDFIGYLFFLPTLLAGPIHRFPDYQHDLSQHRWDADTFSRGLERVLYGYAQIVILGNWFASTKLPALIAGIDPSREALIAYLDALRFGLNVYFQFAGYSNVAIGFALLLGFSVIENFDWPFLRRNISEFWRSWHISLSGWCRAYVYMPVVAVTRNVQLGALATMLAIALWHELSLRYVLWGLYHGLGIVAWQLFQRAKPALPMLRGPVAQGLAVGGSVALTFNFVILSFVLIKEATMPDMLRAYATIFTGTW
ncbi:MBOAT family O-acyltransferase [Azospirillum soli]|uniref:MBOAT family O-acyltransferase n=1 Tax=Azospirillum soli TaxID=1304799 RepID=UPI001AE668FF|nr:MBOAT family O-acyltransferase [Azospirillum soli]MBP2312895.1 alginate O-acetyltransferase complex protein AlgI [Azospirillum soli]